MHFHYALLLQLSIFSAVIHAFYPIDHSGSLPESAGKGNGQPQRRAPLYLWEHEQVKGDGYQPPTVNIRKRARLSRHRGTPVKRDNTYSIQSATPPNYPNSMPVNNDGVDYSYFSTFKVGSTGKEMWLLIDTGAAHTWMFGSSCKSSACQTHRTFGSADSKTLNTTDKPYSVSYGTGNVKGNIVLDSFQFAGFNINMPFGLATDASDEFKQFPIDGILGLGRTTVKDPKSVDEPTVMDILGTQKSLKSNIIGINIWRHSDSLHNGQITFGDVNAALIDGSITYTKTTGSDGLWGIPLDDASANGATIGFKNKRAIVDTGTSAILMPAADAQKLLGGFKGVSFSGETVKLPCDTTGSIKFTFSGVSWEIPMIDILGDPQVGLCSTNIVGRQTFGDDDWLVGDTFLKNVYAVYDFDQSRIGFAKKSDGKSKTSATSASSTQTAQSGPSPTNAKSPGGSSTPSGMPLIPTAKPSETPAQQGGAISQNLSMFKAIATVIVTVYVTVT